nr:PREDICTED: centrosomal protein of 192 kDa [Lepisosteus oculatus]
MAKKPTSAVPKTIVEEHLASEGADSDNCSASLSSFLENEKLMSLDSMNSDSMDDDDIDVAELPDSELEQYFKTLVPPAMQRGQVEGQEIPAAELNGNQENESLPSSPDQEKNRCQFLDDYEQDDFQMPHIRLAATGMDSCPASDEEDTEDELEAALRCSAPRRAFLLSSTTRQLVGESNHPSFRPGLEGGSSDDDETPVRAGNLATNSGIEFRRSAEGQVISSPVTGGGGDGSSGSDKEGSDGGVSTVPLFSNNAQTSSYDVLRGLGIVGGNGAEDEADDEPLPSQLASGELVPRHSEMGDRVGPVGTGEAGSSTTGLVLSAAFPFQRTTSLDRQEALGAMDSAEAAALANGNLDSLYLRIAPRPSVPPDQSDTFLEEAPGSFHLSQVVVPPHGAEGEALGLRGGPCGDSPAPEPRTDSPSEEEEEHLPAAGCRPSLEAKYLSQTFPMEDSDDGWSNCPDSTAPDLNPEGNEKHDVVYQNEEGKWVTDLAYYSCFEKELEANGLENAAEQFQTEDFISASNALEKIAEAEEEFEKEHRFMQEEQMVAQSASLGLGDTSWRLPSRNSILMRASQVSSEFEHSNQSYLRLSLGQFFGQRSEALGCLGVEGQDDVKRPSFGYVITSPEKREPFALIRPSGFSSQGSPGSDDALTFSDADETMNPEDLDRTLEAETSAAVPEAEVRKESLQKDNQDLQPNTPSNQKTCKGNGGSSHEDFMLSISTIASAIADASVSSDPAQLAAMIMQLSKKNQSKKSQTGVQGRAVHSQSEQNSLLEALQKSTSAGELSVLDIEKYLKKTEIPGSDTEAETRSVSPYSFDSPDWADGAGVPLTLWDSFPPADSGGASRVKEGVCTSACDGKDNTADWGSNADNSSTTKLSVPSLGASVTGSAGSARKEIAQRSALPRPKTSYAPVGSSAGSERSVSAGHACGTAVEGIPAFNVGGLQRPIRGSTVKKPGNSGLIKDNGKSGTKLGKVRPNVSSSEMTSLQALGASGLKAEEPGCALPAPRYPPGQRSPPSGLPSNKSAKAGPRGPSDAGESPPKMKTAVKSPAGKGGGGAEKRVSFVGPSPSPVAPSQNRDDAVRSRSPEQPSKCPEESHMTFRPSTSPLTHSSPSQTSSQGAEGWSQTRRSEPAASRAAQTDSGYSTAASIQPQLSADQSSQQWKHAGDPAPASVFAGSHRHFGSEDQRYVPISSFKPQGSVQDLPPAVPTLLTGRSLFTSQIAQQYLGTDIPLHLYHVGPAAGLYGVPPSLAGTSNPVGHVQGSGPLGVQVSTHLLNPVQLYRTPSSLEPPLISAAKPYTSHNDLGALDLWAGGGLADVQARVVVPEELKFPHACCVGIASQTSLSIFNPTERWLQVNMAPTSLSIDGEKVESLPYQLLIVKNKTIIGPRTSEEQKVLFIPLQAGVYHCVLSVSSWPVSAESGTVAQAEAFAQKVVLMAMAETPLLEVDVGPAGVLDFGDLTSGSVKALPLKLINRTHATVPVRLVISTNATAWRCFTFSKSPVAAQAEGVLQAGSVSPLAAPSVMSHVMHANYGENPETFLVWVHFRAPQKYVSSSGTVRTPFWFLYTVHLLAAFGKTVQQTLPLKNAGNINVHLKIKCTDSEDCFSVKPEELHLHAGDEQGLVISFTARGSSKYRERMFIPCLLFRQQKLVLRNNSSSSVQQLRLLIRGQDQDCFQLQSTFGPEERLTNHRELAIRPREDASIHLLFAPTRVACMLAKLEIKQSGMRSSQPGIKFTIPLSGYGGTSNIILEEVKKLSESYVVTLPGIAPGQVSKLTFCMRNTGSRAAFVKAVAFADLQTRTLMDSAVISISPAQFVLKERTQEVITLLCKSTRREQALCQSSSSVLSTVYFFCGDEISRQQLRRFLCNKPEVGRRVLSENSLLKNINFNERFLREEQVTEVYDLPERPNDAQLFYGSMNKVILSVLGSSEAPDCTESHQPSPRRSSEADSGFGSSDRHIGNVSLDVLPVKGPQGPPLALNVPDPALSTSCEPPDTWSVVPEQLVLTAPTINCAADTGHVKIMNKSPRVLGFELSWPAHCLTITPQHGLIEPESHLQILISPNPSLATKSSILPWSGKIYIQCDNQQKFVKVQIREGLALDLSATASSAKPLGVLTAQPETPVLHVAKPQPKALPTKVEIKNRTLVFPTTVSGESSESCLEVENSGEEEVRWYLSSFAPPYVKGVDNSGDVYRATYTAFRCSRVSGTLGSQEKLKVPVSFLPRDRGDYAQFWDLECHPVAEPHMKQRIRFQLCGTGVKDGATAGQKKKTDPENTLIRTETTVKVRKRSGSDASAVKPGGEEATRRGVYAPQDLYAFPLTKVGESSTLKVNVRNSSFATHVLKFISPREPFHIKHSKYSLRSQHYINLPVQFKPGAAGNFATLLLIQTGACGSLAIQLTGEAVENV